MKNLNSYLLNGVFACALAVLFSGCGADSVANDDSTADPSTVSDTATPSSDNTEADTTSPDSETTDAAGEGESTDDTTAEEPEVDPMAALVEGWYVFRLQVTTESELPIIGMTQSSIYNYGVAEIRQEGTGYIMVERHCRYEMSTSEYFTASISDAVPASIEPVSASVTFRSEGDTLTWERSESVVVVGAQLDDPRADELPTTPDDPRVIDQDNDGNPGVTASVDGLITAEVYFVQRQRMAYSGTRSEAGDLMGTIEDASEQNIVDATNSLLMNSGDAVPVPEESNILFIPVTRELSCEQLNGSIETYFGE